MQTRTMLDKYIRRYYTDWLGCSQRWCMQFGIPTESYDLLADVLESLCKKPDALLSDLISNAENGDQKLFFYVRKALRYTILKYRFNRYRGTCPLGLLSDVQCPEVQTEAPDELFDVFRVEEAKFRSDDFIDPRLQYDGSGCLTRFVTHIRTNCGDRTVVRYMAAAKDGHRRQFGRRTSAIAFLMDGNTPPPRKIGGRYM